MTGPENGSTPSSNASLRRLLSRAEALTLFGMILCIASLFLAWPVPLQGKLPGPALVISLTRTGAAIPLVRWPVTAGAILSGLLLAFPPSPSSRMPIAVVQGLGGLVCFVIALTHFAILPGVLVDLLGGALITFAAVDRFSEQQA